MKVIHLSKLEVFDRRYSYMNFPRRRKTFDNTALEQLLIIFSKQTSGMSSRVNVSHCVKYSAACFSLKTSTKDGYFSFSFCPEF